MRFNKLTLISTSIAVMLLSACGGSDDNIGGGSSVGTPLPPVASINSQARYQIVFKNAITGKVITDRLSVTFTGAAELKAADGTSLNGKTITITTGIVGLGASFSATAKDFLVEAGNPLLGWVETGTRVLGDSSVSGDKTLELLLVNTNQAAAINASTAPVTMATATGTVTASGAVSVPVSLATPTKTVINAEGVSETVGSSTLNLPVGVIGTTASGQLPAAGPLKVSVVNYANSNVNSLTAFPGGFAATVTGAPASVLNGVGANAGTFITGGFAQFNVNDSNGNAIKNFTQPIALSIDFPKTTLSANGTTVLKPGDLYPVWSYDDDTGTWKYEKEGTVAEKTPVDPNNYTVKFSTNHLSSWNLGFYVASCTGRINLTGRPAGDTRQLDVEVTGITGRRFSQQGTLTDSQLNLERSPIGAKVTVVVKDQGEIVGSVANEFLCNGPNTNPISVPVVLRSVPVGTVRVETSESCPNGSLQQALPTFTYMSNGTAEISGYTLAASGATVAVKDFTSVLTGAKQIYALNPRTNVYTSKSVSVTANGTVKAEFNFPNLTCPTGAGS